MPTQVDTALLRESFRVLIGLLEERVGDVFQLEADHYWSVPLPSLFNVYESPEPLTIGQMSESLDNLRSGLENDTLTADALAWLADVLRGVAGQVE